MLGHIKDTFPRIWTHYSLCFALTAHRGHAHFTALCATGSWIFTPTPQLIWSGRHVSFTLPLNTGAPQGSVLSPLLYYLFMHDCVAICHHHQTAADSTPTVGLLINIEMGYYLTKQMELWAGHWVKQQTSDLIKYINYIAVAQLNSYFGTTTNELYHGTNNTPMVVTKDSA